MGGTGFPVKEQLFRPTDTGGWCWSYRLTHVSVHLSIFELVDARRSLRWHNLVSPVTKLEFFFVKGFANIFPGISKLPLLREVRGVSRGPSARGVREVA